MADPFADLPVQARQPSPSRDPFASLPAVTRSAPKARDPFSALPPITRQGDSPSPPVADPIKPPPVAQVAPQRPQGRSVDASEDTYLRLIRSGYSPVAAAGMVANAKAESGSDYGAINPTSGASGRWQWLGPRKTALMAFAKERGADWRSPDLQHAFLDKEIDAAPGLKDALNKSRTPEQAARIFNEQFERPGNMDEESNRRASLAGAFFRALPRELLDPGVLKRVVQAGWEGAKEEFSQLKKPELPTGLIQGKPLTEAEQELQLLGVLLEDAGRLGMGAINAVSGAIGQHLIEGGYDPTKAAQLVRDLPAMAQMAGVATLSPLAPAVRLPTGRVVPGRPGQVHIDIPEHAAAGAERGFVDQSGRFLDREQGAKVAQAHGLDVPDTLHSQDLNKAVSAGPNPPSPPPPSAPPKGPVPPWEFQPAKPLAQQPTGVSFLKALKALVNPSKMDEHSRFFEATKRSTLGTANRDTATTQAVLESIGAPQAPASTLGRLWQAIMPERSFLRPHIDEAQRYTVAAREGVLPPKEPQLFDFWNYAEGAGSAPADPNLKALADAVRDEMKDAQAKLAALPIGKRMQFVKDYFPRQYANFEFSTWRKPRSGTIPTFVDAIKQGYEPLSWDPVTQVMNYVTSANRFMAQERAFEIGRRAGEVKFYQSPATAPTGWKALNNTERAASTSGGRPLLMRAYAPRWYANMWNNVQSKGLRGTEVGAALYDGVMDVWNSINLMQLGLSAYHGMTMTMADMASSAARSAGLLAKGKPISALQELAGVNPVNSIRHAIDVAKKSREQYMRIADHGQIYRDVAEMQEHANAVMRQREAAYRVSQRDNFITMWKKGTLLAEARAAGSRIAQAGAGKPAYARVGDIAGQEVIEGLRFIKRAVDTFASPMFDKYIPALKQANYFLECKRWLETHPKASMAERWQAARDISDSVDNRFGEMIQDNLFWHNGLKQVAQLVLRAPWWNLSVAREIGGGAWDMAQGKFTPRAQYIFGMGMAYALSNIVMTYLHTGEGPKSWRDFIAYRTGGIDQGGAEERGFIPGHTSELIQIAHDPWHEAENKLHPGALAVMHWPAGRNTRGDLIYQPMADERGEAPSWARAWAGEILSMPEPIGIKSLTEPAPAGTGFSTAERALGVRRAPWWFDDPEAAQRKETKQEVKDYRTFRFREAVKEKNQAGQK